MPPVGRTCSRRGLQLRWAGDAGSIAHTLDTNGRKDGRGRRCTPLFSHDRADGRERPAKRPLAPRCGSPLYYRPRGDPMSVSRYVLPVLGASAVVLLTAYGLPDSTATLSAQSKVANPITGEGLPNPGAEGDQELGRAARGPDVGHVGRPRRRSEGRPHLGLRALRRRHRRRRSRRLREQPGRPGLQVRSPHRQGARQHRQGHDGDAARHPRRQGRQRLGRRLRRQQGRHQGPPGPQVQPEGREAHEHRHRRQAGQRRWPVQPAQRRRRRARRQHLRVGRPRCAGHDDRRGDRRRAQARRDVAHQQVHARTASSSSRGEGSACVTASSARRTR